MASGLVGQLERDGNHNRLVLARARRRNLGREPAGRQCARALDARLPRPGTQRLLARLEPGAAERRLRGARAPPDPQLPKVRTPRGAGPGDVGLARARAAPRPADAAARLDVLAARSAPLRDGV